jgi:hypothetical protein
VQLLRNVFDLNISHPDKLACHWHASNRPVQITENLGDFWRDTYPKLKQRLQRRVSKHEWR